MAAPQIFQANPLWGTDALFRAWGSAISAALQAMPFLTKTADTGQINWATVTRATATNFAGYEMYAFNDSLQATSPVYIKIEYGTGGSSSYPAIRVTIGTATDGAGALTSAANTNVSVSSSFTVQNNSGSDGLAHGNIVTGEAGELVVALQYDTTYGGGWLFAVSRSRNADGTTSGDETQLWTFSPGGAGLNVANGTTGYQTILHHNQAAQPQAVGSGPVPPTSSFVTSGVKDGVMATAPVYSSLGQKFGAPLKYLICHFSADCAGGTAFNAKHYGTTHAWVSTNIRGTNLQATGQALRSLAVRTD